MTQFHFLFGVDVNLPRKILVSRFVIKRDKILMNSGAAQIPITRLAVTRFCAQPFGNASVKFSTSVPKDSSASYLRVAHSPREKHGVQVDVHEVVKVLCVTNGNDSRE